MQTCKKEENDGKQIIMSIPPLYYTFFHLSGVIIFELEEENLIDKVEESLFQLSVGATYEDEPSKSLELPTILEGATQTELLTIFPLERNFDKFKELSLVEIRV